MRITIIALGSRGDIQPFVPLGKGLTDAGHSVRVATFEEFAPLILSAGLDFYQLRGDAKALLNTAMDNRLLDGRSNPIRFMNAMRKSYATLAETLAQDLSNPELHDSELILNQLPAHLFGDDLAEFLGIPWAIVSVIPLTRTRSYPLIGFPTALSPLPGYNKLTYRLGAQLGWQMFRKNINQWRIDKLKLPAKPLFGGYESIYRREIAVINGFSSQVVPRAPDWGDQIHVTGWWFSEDTKWKPPDDLLRFLDGDDAPVFVGFGSIPVSDPARLTALVVEAVRLAGRRAILHSGWAGLGGVLPDNIHLIDYAPYGWLLPHMAAVVHHGGSGTSGFGFLSGKPSVIVPFGFDQYFWGARAEKLGVAPESLPFRQLTAEELANRIDGALSDATMAHRAANLGRRLKEEDGVARAIELIEQL
jgi:UDP:flavonoid glycosyltransferase YjiC (YdhE family)